MHKRLMILALILLGTRPLNAAQWQGPPATPGLGRPASAAEIAKLDWGVMPDGSGLPAGAGSVAQGERIYAMHCISCHGQGGLGDGGDQLAGAVMQLTDEWPEKTVGTYWPYATTLFDFIRRSMPMTRPGVLSDSEVYAVTAYILHLNGILAADAVLNASTLKDITLPNHEGFIPMPH